MLSLFLLNVLCLFHDTHFTDLWRQLTEFGFWVWDENWTLCPMVSVDITKHGPLCFFSLRELLVVGGTIVITSIMQEQTLLTRIQIFQYQSCFYLGPSYRFCGDRKSWGGIYLITGSKSTSGCVGFPHPLTQRPWSAINQQLLENVFFISELEIWILWNLFVLCYLNSANMIISWMLKECFSGSVECFNLVAMVAK